MAANSKIEWCDHTFNPWIGCTKVAAGCAHCYAETLAKRTGKNVWGSHASRVKTSGGNWNLPLCWNKAARRAQHAWRLMIEGGHDEAYLLEKGYTKPRRPRVFCASMADVFEDHNLPVVDHRGQQLFVSPHHAGVGTWNVGRVATLDDLRRDLFALFDATPHLDWLVLTKRIENALRMWPENRRRMGPREYRHNVWLGTSIANQPDADRNLDELLKCRDLSPVRFVSAEPLTANVDLTPWLGELQWVIVGGESGPKARPCNVAWIRSLVRQCQAADVPCFVKQVGACYVDEPNGVCGKNIVWDYEILPSGPTRRLSDPKGGDPAEWPADLRVREFPKSGVEKEELWGIT